MKTRPEKEENSKAMSSQTSNKKSTKSVLKAATKEADAAYD
jgi:hypothetical protein